MTRLSHQWTSRISTSLRLRCLRDGMRIESIHDPHAPIATMAPLMPLSMPIYMSQLFLSYSLSACLYSTPAANAAKTAAHPVMIARSPMAWQARTSVAMAHHVDVMNAQIARIMIAVGLIIVSIG